MNHCRLGDLTEKYSTMTRAADQGALDGAGNIPEPDARRPSETELNIRNLAQDDLDQFGEEQKTKIDDELSSITERASKIPFVVKRFARASSASRRRRSCREPAPGSISLYKVKLDREKDYRLFGRSSTDCGARQRQARSLFEAWAYIALMLVIDGCLNAFFFKDVGTLGLADGFLIAGIIAGCNIALGFMIGWGPLRFFAHRFKLHLLWAIPVFVLLIIAIAAFNWGVAHYRDLVQVNSKGGFPDVWRTLWTNPFGILSFPSYMMALVGIGVAIYSAARAYTMFDAYPWYGWTFKRKNVAERDFLEESAEIGEKIQAAGDKFLREAAQEYETVNTAAHGLLTDYDKVISRIEQYEATAQSIEDACNAALRIYRVNNVKVRDNVNFPAPAYFNDHVTLRRRTDVLSKQDILIERGALQSRADQLRQSQQDLERGVPDIKLDMLSENSMRKRLEDITQSATDRFVEERALEDEERTTAV